MKRGLIAIGIIVSLLLAVCAVAALSAGVFGWFLVKSEQKSQSIRIIPAAPLTTPRSKALPQTIAESNPTTVSTVGVTPTQIPMIVVRPTETPTIVVTPTALTIPTHPVEQVLEAAAAPPPSPVNSVTQERIGTHVVIPKLGVDAPVVLAPIKNETWQVDHLGQAVGYLEGTAPPGSNSNLVLVGHSTVAEAVYGPFADLGQLAAGDLVLVYEGEQTFQYIIDDRQTVERTTVNVTYPTNSAQITLITCSNWSSAEGRYLQRLVIKGHLVKN